MSNRNARRTAILLVADTHSRTACSVLLRHRGYRVVEASATDDLVPVAMTECADLVVTDAGAEASALQSRLLDELPDVSCIFVSDRVGDTLSAALDAESGPIQSSKIQ